MTTYRCEVLILGGGVLGLWVLNRLLDAKFLSPILLESALLGCRQTGHSDAFLHQGYAYFAYSGVEVYLDAWNVWQPWLPVPIPPIAAPPAYHVYLDANQHQAAVAWRQNPALPPPPRHHQFNSQNPAVGAVAHYAIETDERCVPGDWIVAQLYAKSASHIRKIQEVQQIGFATVADGTLRVDHVIVLMNDGTSARFEPNTLLLCAGERNQDLLAPQISVFPQGVQPPARLANPNQLRLQRSADLDMLVARDLSGSLPDVNGSVLGGIVPDEQGQRWSVDAFVVSRHDLNRERIWVISGRVYRTDSAGQSYTYTTGRLMRRLLIDHLSNIFPRSLGKLLPQMIWGVYPARLTTWRRPVGQKLNRLAAKTIDNMGIDGMLACFTDRLTITPLAAESIEQEISSNLRLRWPSASVPMPQIPIEPVAIHPEYWRTPSRWEQKTSWRWTDFQANCL